jgi:hypothetical protein
LDANGKEVVVFLDVVGFVGDTPAISHVLDVRGHNALAPCPWCSFLRDDNELHRGSRYGFPTSMNARHSSFMRFKSRAESFRKAAPSDKDCQTLGFTRHISAESTPFHELARALSEAKKNVPKNVDGNPVVPACLDPYRACIVAPDHLFFGLSQNVIEAAISCCSVPERKAAESYMLIALRGYGLPVQNKLFGESAPFLLSMSISQVSSVLLVAPAAFRTVKAMRGRKDSTKANGLVEGSILSKNPRHSTSSGVVLHLLQSFQSLVSETMFYPESDLDGTASIDEFNRDAGWFRMDKLYRMACKHVKDLDDVCKISTSLRDILDKPNVHRLIELYAHTIPAYGHVKHVAELLFESGHQPLKHGVTQSNHHEPQVAAMLSALHNDWQSRLALDLCGDKDCSPSRLHRIQRLVAGRSFPVSLRDEPLAAVDRLKVPYLLEQLTEVRRKVYSPSKCYMDWALRGDDEVANGAPEDLPYPADSRCQAWIIRAGDRTCPPHSNGKVKKFESAVRFKFTSGTDNSSESEKVYGKIKEGSVVQCPVLRNAVGAERDGEITLITTPSHKTKNGAQAEDHVMFWYVVSLLGYTQQADASGPEMSTPRMVPYALVRPCVARAESDLHSHFVDIHASTRMLQLGPSVREVLCLHACDKGKGTCLFDAETRAVSHAGRLIDGDEFYMYGRKQGYPPRIA